MSESGSSMLSGLILESSISNKKNLNVLVELDSFRHFLLLFRVNIRCPIEANDDSLALFIPSN